MVFFQSRNIKKKKEEELPQVPVPLDTPSAEKDHVSNNSQDVCNDASDESVEASTFLNLLSRYIRNLDDCLRLLKALSDFLVDSYKPLGGCLSGCIVNIIALLMTTVGLRTGNYWLLTVVVLPILKRLLEVGNRT
jgi:hypothetical protein